MPHDDDDEVLFAILRITLILPQTAWSGYVLTILWSWFVVPLGVTSIGLWHAAGLMLLVGWMTKAPSSTDDSAKKTSSEKFKTALAMAIIVPSLALAVSAIFHALM